MKQIASPGWMHETSARGWCTGMTQRDGMGREVGGGSGWGTHINPWLIHVNVWQKPLQYYKVISLQLIKIKGGKKNLGLFPEPNHGHITGSRDEWIYQNSIKAVRKSLGKEKVDGSGS